MHACHTVAMIGLATALAACPATGAVVTAGRPLSTTCRFASPTIHTDTAGVARVEVAGCMPRERAGQPILPVRLLRLLLPPGMTATGVTARAAAPLVTLPGTWRLDLGVTPAPIGESRPIVSPTLESASRPALAELVSVQRLAGYDFAVVRVYPVAYVGDTGRLSFAPVVNVDILTTRAPSSPDRISPSVRRVELQCVAVAADNPEALAAYESPAPAGALDAATHYLLVTRAALLPAFQPLIDRKTAAGVTVHTETMETITNSYAGVDAAERLRNYIRHAYTNLAVSYVLLGGDTKVVPYRGAYARCSGITLTLMPTDLYFACLDGSWNQDGDGIWGEPNDGETGGDVDLLAEVCVGRAPVETAVEVTNFVARCLAAEQAPASSFRACLAGEYLNSAGDQGGDALDRLLPTIDGSHCSVTWLDDRPQLSAAWTASDAVAALDRAPLLVAHFGHGSDFVSDTTVLRLAVTDLDALANASPFLLYSTACNAGAFDNNFGLGDCIAEELVKRNACGAFAVVANTREGWYKQTEEWRYSGEFQQRFFQRVLADERTAVGVAHQLARQDLLGNVETSGSNLPYRWCYFGITLFGDPHQCIRVPLSLRFRATASERVVTWNSWSNSFYTVYRSTNLMTDAGTPIAGNIPATPPVNVYTDAAPGMVSAFYRVLAENQ
ncbi:MAG: C25 family cysteine peptidase [Kiritimatiellae bacterium]|nr:C25 family cysteine peptidase [Kiritimatiellia bacterium]